jgi:hypothetical protein
MDRNKRLSRTDVRWRTWNGDGLVHLVLTETGRSIIADSVVIGGRDEAFGVRYRLELDLDWRTLRAKAEVVGHDRRVEIRLTGDGHWVDHKGTPLPHLDGAIDVDLAVTPFTNTLPIRRLKLAIGASADIETAYFAFPELVLSRDPQRYTRLSESTYRYESRDSDFTRDLVVDEAGLVVTYPGLFRREI